MKKIFSLFSLVFLFTACEEPIDIDYPEEPTQLVLNANLIPGDNLKASLSLSVPFKEIRNIPYLKDGTIEVFENGQSIGIMRLCETQRTIFEATDSIYIFCLDSICKSETSYTLKAYHPDYEEVQGTTITPKSPLVTDLNYQLSSKQLKFTLNQHSDGNTHYIIEAFQEDSIFSPPIRYEVGFTSRDLTLELVGQNFDVLSIPTGENGGLEGFISPSSFDGNGEKIVDITVNFFEFDNRVTLFRVSSVSESLYHYARTKAISMATGVDYPFAEPYEIYSNVSNNYGIVASHQDTIIKLE